MQTPQEEMSRDSEAQRAVCAALVEEAVARSGAFVDRTLALSNAPELAPYLLGSGRGPLPVAGGFQRDVVAGTFDLLTKQVSTVDWWTCWLAGWLWRSALGAMLAGNAGGAFSNRRQGGVPASRLQCRPSTRAVCRPACVARACACTPRRSEHAP